MFNVDLWRSNHLKKHIFCDICHMFFIFKCPERTGLTGRTDLHDSHWTLNTSGELSEQQKTFPFSLLLQNKRWRD